MRRKVYCKPELTVVAVQAMQLIAASGSTSPATFKARMYASVYEDEDGEEGQIEDMEYEELF